MTDQELADAVVSFPEGWRSPSGFYHFDQAHSYPQTAKAFVRDWRVAGACLEQMTCMQISEMCVTSDGLHYHGWLKKPRAIIEACVKALSTV